MPLLVCRGVAVFEMAFWEKSLTDDKGEQRVGYAACRPLSDKAFLIVVGSTLPFSHTK
jgi:hypothetical protein